MDQPQLVARDQAVSRRVVFDGRISRVFDYFGGASPFDGPQAYLIEQKNYVLRPHFHPVDQFQILRGGPGSLFGRHPIGDLVVHYADAYTVYGPLVGEDPPLRYFTLRAEPTTATEYMPESRALLPGHGGRNLRRDVAAAPTDDLATAPGRSTTLLSGEQDSLDARYVTAGDGARLAVPEAGPSGQFVFVVAGLIEWDGASYPAESVGWQPASSGSWDITAGDDGAGVLILRYPHRTGGAGDPSRRSGSGARHAD